jgi:hypothetical protein
MKTFVVTKGIFENTIFKGEVLNNRVYNKETTGQSYDLENCIEYDPFVEILIKEGVKKPKLAEKQRELILEFCNYDFVLWYFKIDTNKAKNRKEILLKMRDYLNNEGFERYLKLIYNHI